MNLKVGDRVMVYGWVQMHHQPYKPRAGGKASVVWTAPGEIHVRFDRAPSGDEDPNHYKVDPKQCRRLFKKSTRRRVWITEHHLRAAEVCGDSHHQAVIWTKEPSIYSVEFIEVKKK